MTRGRIRLLNHHLVWPRLSTLLWFTYIYVLEVVIFGPTFSTFTIQKVCYLQYPNLQKSHLSFNLTMSFLPCPCWVESQVVPFFQQHMSPTLQPKKNKDTNLPIKVPGKMVFPRIYPGPHEPCRSPPAINQDPKRKPRIVPFGFTGFTGFTGEKNIHEIKGEFHLNLKNMFSFDSRSKNIMFHDFLNLSYFQLIVLLALIENI